MEKEESKNTDENVSEDKSKESPSETLNQTDLKDNSNQKPEKKSPEDIILELEDKLTRTFAEMENQRRRSEKEKEEAFEYGGFNLAKRGFKSFR